MSATEWVGALLEPRVHNAGVDSLAQLCAVEVHASLSSSNSDSDASQLTTETGALSST